MNIQLGIYEIFSSIIPGSVYLVAVGQLLIITNIVSFDWKTINNLSFVSAILFLVAAYLLGIAFSRIALGWYKLFKRENQSVEALRAFKLKHQDHWMINFDDEDWHILLAYIRSRDLEVARENERHQATTIMLRNVSLGFLLLAGINLWQYFLDRHIFFVMISAGFLFLSLLMIRESIKFRRWYYDGILSTVLAYRIDLEKSIKPVEPPLRKRDTKKQSEKQ